MNLLDHLILGIADLDEGIEWFRKAIGVTPTRGGRHPGAGTCNALVSLGNRQYLEIMSLDPQQKASSRLADRIRELKSPRLIAWAAATPSILSVAQMAKAAGYPFEGPVNGSRMRPDGTSLRWKTLRILDDHTGVIPFFIEWSPETVHPSQDSPPGCRIESFEVHHPEGDQILRKLNSLEISAQVVQDMETRLSARLATPNGSIHLV